MNGEADTHRVAAPAALAETAVLAALQAGQAIMEVYGRDFAVDYKEDHSPLTEADRASHQIIEGLLASTGVPVLSEEHDGAPYKERKDWPALWLVDPLDGTKEFIKRNGDFTVNIALIEHGRPVMGVVYLPAHQDLYVGVQGKGAYRGLGVSNEVSNRWTEKGDIFQSLEKLAIDSPMSVPRVIRAVASRSHRTPETDAFMERLEACGRPVERLSRGSALKLCLVASGEAHVYPRLAPTMEWDTAAAQAVIECAGGRVVVYDPAVHEAYLKRGPAALFAADPLRYNRENLLNPWFVAVHPGLELL